MYIISRKTHGTLDYLAGAVLIASPWLFDFYNGGIQAIIPIALGLGAILYSLLTDYEQGIVRVISFSTHLIIDIISGVLLAASPWIFGFSDTVYAPHVALGLIEIAVVLMTDKRPVKIEPVQIRKINKPRVTHNS